MRYAVRKTFDLGLSACFRQWRAKSHCRFLHGYALQVTIEFETYQLDDQNWVIDFGGLKPLKKWLCDTFDHKTLVAEDDPMLGELLELHHSGLIDLIEVKATGCEAFAVMIYQEAVCQLRDMLPGGRVWVASVEVREHGANAAIYRPDLDV